MTLIPGRENEVLFIVGYGIRTNGWMQQSTWYRVFGPGHELSRAGFTVHYAHIEESQRLLRLIALKRIRWAILHRVEFLGKNIDVLNALRAAGVKLTWDVDDNTIDPSIVEDAVHLRGITAAQRESIRTQATLQTETLRFCDNAVFSTPELLAVGATLHDRCELGLNYLPSFYMENSAAYEPGLNWKDRFTVYYGPGSLDHQIHFSLIEKGLCAFLKAKADSLLLLGGGLVVPSSLKRYASRIVRIPRILPQSYFQLLASVSVALAPLRSDSFSRCKSWIKILEPTCQGTPWVASDTANYQRFAVDAGPVGILAQDREWDGALFDVYERYSELKAESLRRRSDALEQFSWAGRSAEYVQHFPQ